MMETKVNSTTNKTRFVMRRFVMFAAVFVAILFTTTQPAQACSICSCDTRKIGSTKSVVTQQHNITRNQTIPNEFNSLEDWLTNDVWQKYFPLLFAHMTHQLTVVAFYQVAVIGTMMDARNQLITQRLLQELTARAHKDYKPSMQMCSFSTGVRSLAAAERLSEVNTAAINHWAQSRHLGNTNVSAAEGAHTDQRNRMAQFRTRYCDMYDNNGSDPSGPQNALSGLSVLCQPNTGPPRARSAALNKDIDYNRTIDSAMTLRIDMTDGELYNDEEDLFALASNLYDHTTAMRIPESIFNSSTSEHSILDIRAITAKRSVAEGSLYAIAGMKSLGSAPTFAGRALGAAGIGGYGGLLGLGGASSADTLSYMAVLLKELGMEPEDIQSVYSTRPSYYAQMEILTKKIYQNPDFYTNLYDTPANVERTGATLQAIGLMQDFDTLSSYLRTEMMLSVLLELEIIKVQENVKKKILAATSAPRNG